MNKPKSRAPNKAFTLAGHVVLFSNTFIRANLNKRFYFEYLLLLSHCFQKDLNVEKLILT